MTQAYSGNDAAIREQAYLLWEQEGRPDGREMEFWTRAQVKVAESEQLKHLTKAPPKRAKGMENTPKAAASKVKASPEKAVKAKADKPDGRARPKKK